MVSITWPNCLKKAISKLWSLDCEITTYWTSGQTFRLYNFWGNWADKQMERQLPLSRIGHAIGKKSVSLFICRWFSLSFLRAKQRKLSPTSLCPYIHQAELSDNSNIVEWQIPQCWHKAGLFYLCYYLPCRLRGVSASDFKPLLCLCTWKYMTCNKVASALTKHMWKRLV